MTTSASYKPAAQAASPFRTRAWVQSWVDVWGNHPRIKLIDLGGRRDPLEMVYTINHKLKGIIPVKSLVIAGNGFADFDPPRAEYNDLESLILLAGDMESLIMELAKYSWNQFVLTDFGSDYDFKVILNNLTNSYNFHITKFRSEMAYRINPINFGTYKKQLGSSTRAKYFNRRDRLANYGSLEITELSSSQEFFEVLNHFHQLRWGRPCYSSQSMNFFSLFNEGIRDEGGAPIMQALRVNGEIISVLFDIVWRGTRYNLQSGYIEGRYGQLALGSLHLGIAIEQALSAGQGYDFLAGNGKHSNYKEKISTEVIAMETYCVAQGWLKHLYRIHGR